MKIVAPGSVQNAANLRRTARSGEAARGAFAEHLSGGAQAASAQQAAASAATQSLSALLAVQEAGDAMERRRRAVRRGQDLLDQLGTIQQGLLLGTLGPAQLRRLAQMLKDERPETPDPRLSAILDDIELRAAVELAKLGL